MKLRRILLSASLAFALLSAGCSVFSSEKETELPALPELLLSDTSKSSACLLRVTQVSFKVRPSERWGKSLTELGPLLTGGLGEDKVRLLRIFREDTTELRAFVYPVQLVADFTSVVSRGGRSTILVRGGLMTPTLLPSELSVEGDASGATMESSARMLNGFAEIKLDISVIDRSEALPEGIVHTPAGSRYGKPLAISPVRTTLMVRTDGTPVILNVLDSGPDDSGRITRNLLVVQVFPIPKNSSASDDSR